ncbi:hypothetical protein D3C86_1341460 [compost metagenome]
MQIVYGQSRPARLGHRQWRNGRLFQAVEPGATAVFLDGDFPAVRRAYVAAGVPVHDGLDVPKPLRRARKAKPVAPIAPASE